MDTQLSGTPDLDNEWAVERILSHAGLGSDAVFEIKWKAGDITWLPYYQITHLDALTDYFDLIGISKVLKLPQGKGIPLADDPQIFIGSLSPFVSHHQLSPIHSIKTSIHLFIKSIACHFPRIFRLPTKFSSITVNFDTASAMTCLRGIGHPNFIHISPTHHEIRSLDYQLPATLHIRQLADIVLFDAAICACGGLADLSFVPLGFTKFALAWNTGVCPDDPR